MSNNVNKRTVVGYVSGEVIEALGLDVAPDTPIYISDNNILHIRETHTDAYIKYYDDLEEIIKNPDYIGIAGVALPSIEYVKRFEINDEYVNIAVRATSNGVHYVRSMFIIEEGRLNDYIKKGKLQKATSPT